MEETTTPKPNSNQMYYVVGAVVVAAVLAAGYFLRPQATPAAPEGEAMMAETSVPGNQEPAKTGPITELACESQYYNPVIGFPQYYLSADGVDVEGVDSVTCEFTVSSGNRVVATESATSPLTAQPQRGGQTFRCSTAALTLEPGVPTDVDVTVTNSQNDTATCTKTFVLPTP